MASSSKYGPVVSSGWVEAPGGSLPARDDDAWSEWEDDEVCYLTLDFGTHRPAPEVLKRATDLQLVGLNTETPYVKLGDFVFQGRHERLIGDDLLFRAPAQGSSTSAPDTCELIGTSSYHLNLRPATSTSSAAEDEDGKLTGKGGALIKQIGVVGKPKPFARGATADGEPKKRGRPKKIKVDEDEAGPSGTATPAQEYEEGGTPMDVDGEVVTMAVDANGEEQPQLVEPPKKKRGRPKKIKDPPPAPAVPADQPQASTSALAAVAETEEVSMELDPAAVLAAGDEAAPDPEEDAAAVKEQKKREKKEKKEKKAAKKAAKELAEQQAAVAASVAGGAAGEASQEPQPEDKEEEQAVLEADAGPGPVPTEEQPQEEQAQAQEPVPAEPYQQEQEVEAPPPPAKKKRGRPPKKASAAAAPATAATVEEEAPVAGPSSLLEPAEEGDGSTAAVTTNATITTTEEQPAEETSAAVAEPAQKKKRGRPPKKLAS